MNELAKSKTAKHRVAANKWYADNKESANREKIKKRIKDGQMSVRPTSILKYKLLEYTEENNKPLYNKLIKNYPEYSKQLSAQETVAKGGKKSYVGKGKPAMTIMEMEEAFDEATNWKDGKPLEQVTRDGYKSRLRTLMSQLNCEGDVIKCFREARKVIEFDQALHPKGTRHNLIAIKALIRASEKFKKGIGERAVKIYNEWAMKGYEQSLLWEENKTKDPALDWKKFVDNVEAYSKKHPDNEDGILMSLYAKFPLRDDFGDIKIYITKEEAKEGVKDHPNQNYYIIHDGILSLASYKNSKKWGRRDYKVGSKLRERIWDMLVNREAKYKAHNLPSKKTTILKIVDGKPVKKSVKIVKKTKQVEKLFEYPKSKLSGYIRDITKKVAKMPMSINDIRHSRVAYGFDKEELNINERRNLAKLMLSSLSELEHVYKRQYKAED